MRNQFLLRKIGKGKKYNRFLTENSVRWDDPNYDRIKALMMVSNPSYT
ncbi:MAG: hypothetical protein HPY57_16185 [Ignavibacteria bacterium]|nr:hypothetical protein [Ignavibacteria bacterium]